MPGTLTIFIPPARASLTASGPMLPIAASPVRTIARRVLCSGTSSSVRRLNCGVPRQCGYVTASYSMRSPGTLRTNFHGPLPIGFSRNPLAPTVSMYFFGMTEPSMKTARERLAANCGMTPLV